MKYFLRITLSIIFLNYAVFLNVYAQEEVSQLYAAAAVLMDADSGRVLYEKNGSTHMPNASTTKILTAIIAIESERLDEVAKVSSYAASMPKVHLGTVEGQEFLLKDLMYSLMLESHNDAAVIIAEHIAGSVEAFAEQMNEKARNLGCSDTYFITPNGLDAQDENGVHGTTAQDLARILSYAIKNEQFLEITQTMQYSFSDIGGTRQYSCTNHNAFLQMMEGALSGKTGFTANAGYCYAGALKRGDRTFVVALLACGWPNNKNYKWSDTKKLMEYALKNYEYEDVFEHEKEFAPILVQNAVPTKWSLDEKVVVQPQIEDTVLNVLKRKDEKVEVTYNLDTNLKAPIKAGVQVGEVCYRLGNTCIGRYPIFIKEGVKEKNGEWYFRYILNRWFLASTESAFGK